MADKMILGLSLTVIGISITFVILFLLQILMNAEAYVVNRSLASKQARELPNNGLTDQPATADNQNQTTVPENPPSAVSPQVIAAIMGAIAHCTGQPAQNFRLVSIRQAWDENASTAWKLNSRMDVINRRNSFYAKGGTK